MLDQLQANPLLVIQVCHCCCCICTDSLFPSFNVSSVTATTATVSLSPPTNFTVTVLMYLVTMFSITCNGVPSRGVTTTSKSVTVDNLRAGIQYC